MITRIHAKVTNKDPFEQCLIKQELDFLKWFAVNSRSTREEFGNYVEIETEDPQESLKQINQLLDEKFGSNEEKQQNTIDNQN